MILLEGNSDINTVGVIAIVILILVVGSMVSKWFQKRKVD